MESPPVVPSFQSLGQYGIAGAIAALLLFLFLGMFKRMMENMMEQNKHLQERHQEIQQQQIIGLAAVQRSIDQMSAAITADIRHLSQEIAEVFNSLHRERRGDDTGPIRLGVRRPPTRTGG